MTVSETSARTPREITEWWEGQMLAPQAMRSVLTRGRVQPDPPCPYRTEYQRDRDRILHSKSFRRLAAKTQVFVQPRTDHDRTRLTHTLEVCQVARTIARALQLNEDLTEAIALGHDLGHSPFGHSGETALDAAYRDYDPAAHFRHSEQSLRVVEVLERDGRGLNLTWEVRDGIVHHSKGPADWPRAGAVAATLEGQLVALCDRIAYSSHDIDDALRAGLLRLEDLPADIVAKLGATHSTRLTVMVGDVINASHDLDGIAMSPEMTALTNALKDFMYENVYLSRSMAPDMRVHIRRVITDLFHYYMDHPAAVPGLAPDLPTTERARAVCDHIAGMTDNFAQQQYDRLLR
ncbi:MAG TPA: deoxyguanosinetriphosphate triphosphohydrolase [Armatimonadota bacterium]|jgi:dGTPase